MAAATVTTSPRTTLDTPPPPAPALPSPAPAANAAGVAHDRPELTALRADAPDQAAVAETRIWAVEVAADTLDGAPAARTPDLAGAAAAIAELPSGRRAAPPVAAGPRAQGGAVDLAPFSMAGVTFPGADGHPEGPVLVRFRADGAWSEWLALDAASDHTPDVDDGVARTEPFWIGDADGYEVNVAATLAPHTEVVLISETTAPPSAEARSSRASTPAPSVRDLSGASQPPINPRSTWTSRPPNHALGYADRVGRAVVHHAVSTNSYNPSDVPGILRGIQAYHMDSKGWWDIAYNFAVDKYGVLWEGRKDSLATAVIGGHARGFNTGSVGIVALGDYTSATPTAAATNAIGALAGWKLGLYGADPLGHSPVVSLGSDPYPEGVVVDLPHVIGHRDVGWTSCPGNNLYPALTTIRNAAALKYQEVLPFAFREQLVGDFDGDGFADSYWYGPGPVGDAVWFGSDNATFTGRVETVNGFYETHVLDANGDGRDDILWYRPGTEADYVWLGRADRTFTKLSRPISGRYETHVGDFDADGRDDLFLYAPGVTPDYFFYGTTNGMFTSVATSITGDYRVTVFDTTGDRRDDLLLYRDGPDPDYLWFGRADRTFSRLEKKIDGDYVVTPGDFDGDGDDDLLLSRVGIDEDHLWRSKRNGGFTATRVAMDRSFWMRVADYDGDGRDDVMLYAPGTAKDLVWYGTTSGPFSAGALTINGTYWPGVGDFDGDGGPEVFLYRLGPGDDYLWSSLPNRTFATRSLTVVGL